MSAPNSQVYFSIGFIIPLIYNLFHNPLKVTIMAKGKNLKAPTVDLKEKKQEKIKQKLEAKQTRKRK